MSRAETVAADRHTALVDELASGRRRFHELPADLEASVAAAIRRAALERITDTSLSHMGNHSFDVERATRHNCENVVGVAQVPLGVVGPLPVRGEAVDGDVYVPLATTEGALVASTNRGCAAVRAGGGVAAHCEEVGMTRAPVFRTDGLAESRELVAWVRDNEKRIRDIAEATSRYLRLTDIRPFVLATTVFLRFRFESGDAMGMNMATIACDRVVTELIEPETGVDCVALSGNYCVDKKPAAINFHEGRGKRLFAEAELPGDVLDEVLKTDAESLIEVQYRKNFLGSIAAGSKGFNAHYANVLAAFFVATGQDLAHVVEGSMGVTCIESRGDGIHFSIFLPAVPLGAIGGGTGLDTQREALTILGVEPSPLSPGHAVRRLGEILAATVLAGELSLMAAFTSRDLAGAHERLARGRGESPAD